MAEDNDSTNDGRSVSLTSLDGRLERIQADLRDLIKERRELSVLLMELNRSIQRGPDRSGEISADKRALIDLKKEIASAWENYAVVNRRIDDRDKRFDRLERRLGEIERRLDKLEGREP